MATSGREARADDPRRRRRAAVVPLLGLERRAGQVGVGGRRAPRSSWSPPTSWSVAFGSAVRVSRGAGVAPSASPSSSEIHDRSPAAGLLDRGEQRHARRRRQARTVTGNSASSPSGTEPPAQRMTRVRPTSCVALSNPATSPASRTTVGAFRQLHLERRGGRAVLAVVEAERQRRGRAGHRLPGLELHVGRRGCGQSHEADQGEGGGNGESAQHAGVVVRSSDVVPDGTVGRWTTSAGRPGPRSTSPSSSPPSRAGTTPATPPPRPPATSSTAGTPSSWPTSTPRSSTTSPSTRPAGPARRRRPARDRVARHRDLRRPRSPAPSRTSLLIVGTEPQLRWRTFCEQVIEVAQAVGARLVRHPRRAARRGAPHPADAGRRHRLRRRHRRRASSCSRRTTRGPPASSGCSTTRGAAPASARRRCGPPCRPTCPARRRRRRRSRWSSAPPRMLADLGAHHRPRDRVRVLRAPGQRAGRRRRGDRDLRRVASRSATTTSPASSPAPSPSPKRSSASSATSSTRRRVERRAAHGLRRRWGRGGARGRTARRCGPGGGRARRGGAGP